MADQPNSTAQRLPPEARAGLERAWLAILAERHPGVKFEIVKPKT